MTALVYHGSKDVRIKQVPDANIEQPTDVLVKITTTNICGSDLHMYEGRTDVEKGKVLGDENLGKVIKVGMPDPASHEVPNMTMNDLKKSVRASGDIGVVGVFIPKGPTGADQLGKKGQIACDFYSFFGKGLHMGTGQTNVKAYNRLPCNLIHAGRARPSWICFSQA